MSDEATPTEIQFSYIKSTQFRVVHADGVIGGITPRGLLHMAVYNERPAIPQLVVQHMSEGGQLGATIKQLGRTGVVREIEVDLLLDMETVEALHRWLGDRLTQAKELGITIGESRPTRNS